jgi:hypothetical protein
MHCVSMPVTMPQSREVSRAVRAACPAQPRREHVVADTTSARASHITRAGERWRVPPARRRIAHAVRRSEATYADCQYAKKSIETRAYLCRRPYWPRPCAERPALPATTAFC